MAIPFSNIKLKRFAYKLIAFSLNVNFLHISAQSADLLNTPLHPLENECFSLIFQIFVNPEAAQNQKI